MSVKKQAREIYKHHFQKRDQPLQLYEDIAERCQLSYPQDTQMRIYGELRPISNSSDEDALVLWSETRTEDDWISFDVDLDPACKALILHFRYAPAETVYLAAIGYRNGVEERIGLESVRLPDHDLKLKVEVQTILQRLSARPEYIKLMLLFPFRPWFCFGLQSVEEVK